MTEGGGATGTARPGGGAGEGDERLEALRELEGWLETPMLVLSAAWLALVLVELVRGEARYLETFGTAIWAAFIAEFALRLALAPEKGRFLRGNLITLVALAVPALRMFRALRVLRVARAARGLRLVRIVGTANRGMNALRRGLGRRGLGYVLAATLLVALLGAAGMLAFEPAAEVEGGFRGYGDALWWTAMLLTGMGSEFWPRTGEGRLLTLLVSLFGFAVFGYVTASLASFLVGREAADRGDGDGPARAREVEALRREVAGLREALSERR